MSEDGRDLSQYSPEASPRPTGIGERFVSNLKEKVLLMETPEFESVGVAATEGTNERGDPDLFDKVRHQKEAPNGYLIGIGAANVFSMLEAYPEGQEPRAIILFDIDPAVVAEGQRLINSYKETPTGSQRSLDSWERIFSPYWNASPTTAMKKYAGLLHQLASEGNLVIARADFNNPKLTEELANLPDFKKLNNVIYLSNIADHLWRRGIMQDPSYIPNFNSLTPLVPDSPNQNYYIDTLQHGLSYRVRVSTTPPQFSERDFNFRADMTNFQTEPTDQIDGPNVNLLWEDTSQWSLEQLIHSYNQILHSPDGEQRREHIEEQLRRRRADTVKSYPESKRKAKLPPEEIYPGAGRFTLYQLPEDPTEEERMLADLQKPYDYERDFVSFLAHGYWQDAATPGQVYSDQIPSKPLPPFNNMEEYREYSKYIRTNPRENMRGQIEVGFVKQGITYEDLALAKLYREMEKRVMERRSGAQTQGKNFFELSTEAKSPV